MHRWWQSCTKKNLITNLILVFVIPLVTLLTMEVFNAGTISRIYLWISLYPREFLGSYLLLFGLVNLFYLLPRKAYVVCGGVFLALFSIMGYISHVKSIVKGAPLVPTDFFLVKEAIGVSAGFKQSYFLMALIMGILCALIIVLLRVIPKEKYKWQQKVVVFLLSTAILSVIYGNFGGYKQAFHLQLLSYSQKWSYEKNGMVFGFILEMQYSEVTKPDNYQEKVIQQIIQDNKTAYPVDENFKPNIIFVMSESFWDPTVMANVTYSQDPIPFFHSLQKSQTGGILFSPSFGGGTANTEMEVLTGFSTSFMPSGVIPYSHYINKPIEALPAILQKQGYATAAIHTYHNWFYNRNKVYQDFGFDKFISEEFLNDPEYKDKYIRDTELTKKILEEVSETPKPDFIFAVSMEAHMPYSTTENEDNTITISDGKMSTESQAILANYTNTISDADQALKRLIEGMQQIKEPTLVVFFGDHLPFLGDDYNVYLEAGFIEKDNSYQDYLKLHSVPFVTWDNFSSDKKNLRLSPNFIGTMALEIAKKSGSPMQDYLSNLMQQGSDAVVSPYYSDQEDISATQMEQYNLLQYDLLFGEDYAYQLEPDQKPVSNRNYIQGDGAIIISEVTLAEGGLIIRGENFVQNAKVYINDKPVEINFKDSKNITVDLAKNLQDKGQLTIQIKVTDSQKNVISESNAYNLR